MPRSKPFVLSLGASHAEDNWFSGALRARNSPTGAGPGRLVVNFLTPVQHADIRALKFLERSPRKDFAAQRVIRRSANAFKNGRFCFPRADL